jgi:hypothetical protein
MEKNNNKNFDPFPKNKQELAHCNVLLNKKSTGENNTLEMHASRKQNERMEKLGLLQFYMKMVGKQEGIRTKM